MRGRVLGVDTRTGDGVVAGDDGRRYTFRPEDWATHGEPAIGIEVDFETDRQRALSVFPLPVPAVHLPHGVPAADRPRPRRPTHRSRRVAAILALAFGILGLHRFYLGRNGAGVAALLLTVTGVGLAISLPWAIVDFVRLLLMGDGEFARRYADA